MHTKSRAVAIAAALLLAVTAAVTGFSPAQAATGPRHHHKHHHKHHHRKGPTLPGGYKHLVVIYEENHSFDNLYGSWGKVNGQRVVGLADATAAKRTQRAQDGTAYSCLPQNDVNLTSPPLSNTCQDAAHGIPASHFRNAPFRIDDFIKPADRTCPPPGVYAPHGVLKDSPGAEPGGCTEDIVHRFYQEQYQIDGGKQDHYTTGSDAVGLTQGTYDTKTLPIYRYLHGKHAPKYTIADHFFQAAFGGSFLNHQWLIAARSPYDRDPSATYTPGTAAKNSVIDSNGMPTSYPQYTATGPTVDDRLTRKCAGAKVYDRAKACGNFAVNTIQPGAAPHGTGPYLPLLTGATIGDRLSAKGISWKWYSGGWDDAEAGHAGPLFQYHHQPFNYFAAYAPGKPGRKHLQDEKRFVAAAKTGHLPTVSFVKPYGAENEHPGYASESNGSDHLVNLLKTIRRGPQAKDTLVVVTYDEFGGQWDHVSPPKVDAWGPGTRIPALILGGRQHRSAVDHRTYDTTSILATIERSYRLRPLSSRDARVRSLAHAVAVGRR